MDCRKYGRFALLILLAAAGFFTGGCEAFKEALDAELEYGSSSRGSSDDYRPRFVLAVCSIVKYPRAMMIEQEVNCNGSTICINTNQLFDSKRIREAKAAPRPGNPDVCDLELKLDSVGKNHWQMLVASSRGEPVALMIDKRCVGTFIPEMPHSDSDRINWVKIRIGLDPYTARGVVRFAKSNHEHFNPEAGDWFRF